MAKVLLIGAGATAESAFESLAERFDLVAVVRPLDPHNGQTDPVALLAMRAGVPVLTDASPRAIRRAVAELRPDCVVISSYGRLLGPETIASCPFLNVHYAPLPKYRGMAPVNWAILNHEPSTAFTLHTVVEGMDAGRIVFQQRVPIEAGDTVADVYDRLNAIQRRHLGEAVTRFLNGETGTAQDDVEATYGCNRLPQDGEIDWNGNTRDIEALVRALVAPFPGAFTYFRGRRLVVWRALPVIEPPVYAGRVPGRVAGLSKNEGWVDVLTGDGVLRLLEVQMDGGTRVAPSSLIMSVRTTLGMNTTDLLARIESLEARVAELVEQLRQLTDHAAV